MTVTVILLPAPICALRRAAPPFILPPVGNGELSPERAIERMLRLEARSTSVSSRGIGRTAYAPAKGRCSCGSWQPRRDLRSLMPAYTCSVCNSPWPVEELTVLDEVTRNGVGNDSALHEYLDLRKAFETLPLWHRRVLFAYYALPREAGERRAATVQRYLRRAHRKRLSVRAVGRLQRSARSTFQKALQNQGVST